MEALLERALFLTSSGHCIDGEGEIVATMILALLEEHKNANQVKDCLESCGHEVLVVDTFVKAKALLKTQKVDLIISDVHLENGGSVFDFLRWAKKAGPTSEIPFMLFSNQPSLTAKYLADGVRMSARVLGAVLYLEMDAFDAAIFQENVNALLTPNQRNIDQTRTQT